MENLTFTLWVVFSILLAALDAYGVDIAAASSLLATLSLWMAVRRWRKQKQVAAVFGWLSLSVLLLLLGVVALMVHFHGGGPT